MNILVLGWYGHHNCGDDSYTETFRALFPQHSFTFTDSLQEKDVNKCEAIILGGGNVLRHAYIEQLKKVKNKKIYGLSIGIEEPPTCDLSFFTHIWARDSITLEILKRMNVPCSFIPDAAMTLKADEKEGRNSLKKRFSKDKNEIYSKIITVVINSYMMYGGPESLARDALNFIQFSYDFASVADNTPASFVFIPFGTLLPHDDRASNAWVASKCKFWKKNHVIFDRPSYRETLNIISASDLVISSRLHSSIFSYISGVPFIDITHHSKNELFLEMIGNTKNSISFWNFDKRELKNKIKQLIDLPKHQEHEKFRSMVWEKTNEIRFN